MAQGRGRKVTQLRGIRACSPFEISVGDPLATFCNRMVLTRPSATSDYLRKDSLPRPVSNSVQVVAFETGEALGGSQYATTKDLVLKSGIEHRVRQPLETFINFKNMVHFRWLIAFTRVMSGVVQELRRHLPTRVTAGRDGRPGRILPAKRTFRNGATYAQGNVHPVRGPRERRATIHLHHSGAGKNMMNEAAGASNVPGCLAAALLFKRNAYAMACETLLWSGGG